MRPSIANISGGISCGSGLLYLVMSSAHGYPTISSAAGVKKVIAAVADTSVINPLKLYLCIIKKIEV